MSGEAKRVALVTGANTGIGRATAAGLGERGYRVLVACRSEVKGREAVEGLRQQTGGEFEYLSLDLASLQSVRRAAEGLLQREQTLHVLLNNAGVGGQRGRTEDGFELHFGVNHLGHFLLTQLLLDRLKASAPARIVNVSSGNHYQPRAIDFTALQESTPSITGLPEYGVSKLANVLFTRELARRLTGSGVTSYALNPGRVASDVWRRLPWPIRPIFKRFMLTNEQGALTSIYCATDEACEEQSGRYYDRCREKRPSELAFDDALALELWNQSEAWVNQSRPA